MRALIKYFSPFRIKALAVIGLIIISITPILFHAGGLMKSAAKVNAGPAIAISENRTLANLPQNAESFTAYTRALDDYINDHFGLRLLAIKGHRAVQRALGGGTQPVYTGPTAWLFLGTQTMWDSYQGLSAFNAETIDAYVQMLRRLKQRSDENGIAFAATIAPNKSSIYTQHVPERFGEKSQHNFHDALMQNRSAKDQGLINVMPRLLALKDTSKLYFETDTHWTESGAFEAYRLLMRALQKSNADLPVLTPSDLTYRKIDNFKGDLLTIGSIANRQEIYQKPRVKKHRRFDEKTVENKTQNKTYNTVIYTAKKPTLKPRTIVLLGDSFSNGYIQFLQASFDEIIFIHHQNGGFDSEEVFSYNPDAIIFTVVERFAERMKNNKAQK